MKALLVHNPSAGTRTQFGSVEVALSELRKGGWEAEGQPTLSGGDATKLTRNAAEAGYDAVFAVGGDGTVNEVLNGLVGSNTSLGVLPFGTANVWAKEMGLPMNDMAAAANLQAQAPSVCVDVGEVIGEGFGPRAFLLWCGVGFDAHITAEIEPQRALKRRLGALMFLLYGARAVFTFRGQRARLDVDGQRHRTRLLLALASNAQLYGGLVRISPGAKVDDGLLDVAVFRGTGVWRTAWHLLRVFLGWHLNAVDVEHYRARNISIQAPRMPVHVDAEPIGVTPVRISIRPQAVRVLVPQTANRLLFVDEAKLKPPVRPSTTFTHAGQEQDRQKSLYDLLSTKSLDLARGPGAMVPFFP
jgi:diacylglycerol kinase (ATP)